LGAQWRAAMRRANLKSRVVSMRGIGPPLSISCNAAVGADRNLTNRTEEAIGDCTNIHAAYPASVYGFVSLIKANTGPPESDTSGLSQ
jgi:hypothetical protein